MVLNAVQNGAKCKAKRHKNTLQWYKLNLLVAWNTWRKRAKWSPKCGFLGVKYGRLGLKNYVLATKLES